MDEDGPPEVAAVDSRPTCAVWGCESAVETLIPGAQCPHFVCTECITKIDSDVCPLCRAPLLTREEAPPVERIVFRPRRNARRRSLLERDDDEILASVSHVLLRSAIRVSGNQLVPRRQATRTRAILRYGTRLFQQQQQQLLADE